MTGTRSPIRLGIVDTDSGFVRVLRHRLESAGWQQRVLASPVPADALEPTRLGADDWINKPRHPGDRSVDVFVRKLRQKLECASPAWRYIHTHHRIGYRFDAEPVAEAAEAVV